MMSAGVAMASRMGRHSRAVTTANSTAKPPASQMMFPTKRLSSGMSFDPNRWDTGMVNPVHTPMQNPKMRKVTEPVDPTAARGPVPKNFPTMMVSTME